MEIIESRDEGEKLLQIHKDYQANEVLSLYRGLDEPLQEALLSLVHTMACKQNQDS
tara:strand:- start:90 stop:257 length:168 start_codon:yes stop_codon:yes gene_type:complete